MTVSPPAASSPASGPTRRADPEAPLPLTPGQERMWFIDRFNPGWPAHDELVYRLRGTLDEAVLEAALNTVFSRHEAVWARFLELDGEPRQVFVRPTHLPLEVVDLSGLPDDVRQAELDARVVTARTAPFDLHTPPLLRATLIRLGRGGADERDEQDEHVLCLVLHHIACDGTSWAVLLHELREHYAALLAGREVPEPPAAVDYGDYVRWQHERSALTADTHLGYWVENLRGTPRLQFPTDRLRPAERDFVGGQTAHREVPPDVRQGVEALARQLRCTPFMLFLAVWQAVLSRHSGQLDLCVGTPTAGRSHPDLEQVVGLFINTLPLRGDLSGDPSFTELVRRTRRTVLGAMARQDVPYESIVKALDLPRDPTGGVLFQNMLIVHTEEQPPDEFLPGVSGAPLGDGDTYVTYDLVLDIWMTGGALVLMLRSDKALHSPATTELLLAHVENALRAVVADPGVRLSALPLDDEETAARLRRLGTGPQGPTPPPDVVDLIDEQVRARPDAPAVSCGDTRLTYAELDAAAGELADRLRAAGAVPGSLVAVCLPRTTDLVVALLAVLRTGAGYLPLDPADPPARREAVLALASPMALFDGRVRGRGRSSRRLPSSIGATSSSALLSPGTVAPSSPHTTDTNLSYVIFTSGSTGTPKGVMVPRSAVASRVAWMRDEYRLGPGDRVVQFATVAFDTHVEEIYPTLAAGAELVLLPPGEQLPDLLAGPAGAGVTVLDLPTPYWHELVASGSVRWPESLRLLILGADQVEPWAVGAWLRQAPGVEVLNGYGPTETTVIATTARLDARDEHRRPGIGLPLADTAVHVVDELMRPVASGESGELLVGGAGVALGYLGRPGLTAERFVPDPFGPPGSRLYRTGDRVRWRHDGQLEFRGRFDSQVKLRGFRVEPGEVRARLAELPGVRQAAVRVIETARATGTATGTGDDLALVGYVVVDPATVPGPGGQGETPAQTGERLRRALADVLPRQLVPSSVVVLDAMPLGPTGKLDPEALPAPAPADRAAPAEPPSSDAELLVAQVWQDVLGRGDLSVADDFFALGGHSLTAVRVVSRLTAALGTEVPLRTVFATPTLGALATTIEEILLSELADDPADDPADESADKPAGGTTVTVGWDR